MVAQALATVPTPPAAPVAPPVAVPTPPVAPTPLPIAVPTPPSPAPASAETQYQAPQEQYHPVPTADSAPQPQPTTAAASAPAQTVQPDVHQLPLTSALTPTQRQREAPEIAAPNSGSSSLPSTWIWNWNWNCATPPAAPPNPGTINNATGTWTWNWNHNCEPPQGAGQYQGVPTQYQPQNLNVSIRVASPGDNGPVTQTIAAITQTTATTVNTITQTVAQTLAASTPAPIPTIPLATVPVATAPRPPPVARAVGALITTIFGAASALPASVALPLSVVVLPTVVVPLPTSLTGFGPELLPGLRAVAAPPGKKRSRPAFTSQPQQTVDAGPAGAWFRPAPEARANERSRAPQPLAPSRPPLPISWPSIPLSASAGGASGVSGASAAAAAVAALLASYLLVPPFGARRVRAARDSRRLRPRASRLERPG
jgi:hypothetical protein